MKINHRFKRATALVLGLAIGICLIPAADDVSAVSTVESMTTGTGIQEVVSLREENAKHFDLGNGKYQAVVFGYPIHEMDNKGNWQDITNNLLLSNVKGKAMYSTEDSRVSFAKNYAVNQPIMALQEDDVSVSMSLVSDQASVRSFAVEIPASVSTADRTTQYTTIDQAVAANHSSSVIYKDVLNNTDLEYIVNGNYVKENIIVKESRANYDYTFEMLLSGMYAQMKADGSVGLYCNESNEEKYVIPVPYMYDGIDTLSLDVTYELVGSSGKYFLTVDASETWINAEDRVFPVTIDPSFVMSTGETQDTYSAADSPNTNFASSTSLWVQSGSITYIKTPTISVPDNAKLDWAYLTAFYYYSSAVTAGSVEVGAYKVKNSWNQNTLTWNTMSALSNHGLSATRLDSKTAYGNVGATVSSPKQVDFSITSAVNEWINGGANYGIGLKYENGPNLSVVFRSYESGYDYRPRITYQYSIYYKYKNLYDTTFSSARVGQIPDVIQTLSSAFERQLGAEMGMNGSAIQETTLTGACGRGNNQPCNSSCGEPHHKDVKNISSQLYNEANYPRDPNEIVVFWTNHANGTFCAYATNTDGQTVHTNFHNVFGMVVANRPIIHMLRVYAAGGSNLEYEAAMMLLLAHETAHSFGLGEIYNSNSTHADPLKNWGCAMEVYKPESTGLRQFYQDIEAGDKDAFCSGCAQTLRPLVANGLHG